MKALIFAAVLFASYALAQAPAAKPKNPDVHIWNPETIHKPVGRYSHVAEISGGKLVYVAGQVGISKNGELAGKDFGAQAKQALENIKAAVEAAGGSVQDLVKTNYYVVQSVSDEEMRQQLGPARQAILGEHMPASTLVYVQRLVRPEYLIEIEAVAVIPKKRQTK